MPGHRQLFIHKPSIQDALAFHLKFLYTIYAIVCNITPRIRHTKPEELYCGTKYLFCKFGAVLEQHVCPSDRMIQT